MGHEWRGRATAFCTTQLLLSPLVVISHSVEYVKYLECAHGDGQEQYDNSPPCQELETLGFCTGLLSASAVASSKSQVQFEKYGALQHAWLCLLELS